MSTTRFYNNKYTVYGINPVRLKHILDLVPRDATKILDLGCGRGVLAQHLVADSRTVVGTDISEQALAAAAEYTDEQYCFDLSDPEWPHELTEQTFDCIIAAELLEHVFEPEALLRRLSTLLSADGVIIITTPNVLFISNRLKMLFGIFEYKEWGLMDRGHVHFFTPPSFRNMIKKINFTIVQQHNYYPTIFKNHSRILGLLFPNLFAYQIIATIKPQSLHGTQKNV